MVFDPKFGLSTLVTHVAEGNDPLHAHVMPIYQTSTFGFENVAASAAIFEHEAPGYVYTRLNNPNQQQLAEKIAVLEGLDLLRAQPTRKPEEVVAGLVSLRHGGGHFGHAGRRKQRADDHRPGELCTAPPSTAAQPGPAWGIETWCWSRPDPEPGKRPFSAHPDARPGLRRNARQPHHGTDRPAAPWLRSPTATTPGCWWIIPSPRPTASARSPWARMWSCIPPPSTSPGTAWSSAAWWSATHLDWVHRRSTRCLKMLGGSASPFDCWLANIGLKTFELRMQRHCENAWQVARFLEGHPRVERVYYPGLESHPDHELAKPPDADFGGMMSFELKGGMQGGRSR